VTDKDTDTEEVEEQERESEERRRRRENEDIDSGTKEPEHKEKEHRAKLESGDTVKPEDEAEPEPQSEVPQIELQRLTPETKELDTDAEELAEGEIGVPQVKLLYESVDVRELDDEIEEQNESGIGVPQIEIGSDTWVDVLNLDASIIFQEDDEVEIPQLKIKSAGTPETIDLITKLENPIEESMETSHSEQTDKEKDEDEEVVEQQIYSVAPAGSSSSGAGELPTHDPFELLFSGHGGENPPSNKPVVIWLDEEEDESYLRTLEWICSQIYREKAKSKNPDFRRITDMGELKKEAGKSWVDLAENKLFSVELTHEEYKELNVDDVEPRLEELAFQDFGFLIFNTPRHVVSEIDVNKHPVNNIEIRAREHPPEILANVQKLCMGFIESPVSPEGTDADEFFNEARVEYKDKLKELAHSEGGVFWDVAEPDETGESGEHRQMKAIVTKILVEELREENEEDLETPPQIMDHVVAEKELDGQAVPDIYIEDKQTVFEIETLFSEDMEGELPRDKLSKSFKKYKDTSVDEVNIVLDSMAFLRHLNQIVELQKNWTDWEYVDFHFYALDLENERLVPTDEIVRNLKEIQAK